MKFRRPARHFLDDRLPTGAKLRRTLGKGLHEEPGPSVLLEPPSLRFVDRAVCTDLDEDSRFITQKGSDKLLFRIPRKYSGHEERAKEHQFTGHTAFG
jgi:hypothetical protein